MIHGIQPEVAVQRADMPQHRLVKAAHEFEAQLMKELLKPMTGDDAFKTDADDAGPGGILGEFAAEALGRSLSEHGGMGIADRIVQSFSKTGNASHSEVASVKRLTDSREMIGNG